VTPNCREWGVRCANCCGDGGQGGGIRVTVGMRRKGVGVEKLRESAATNVELGFVVAGSVGLRSGSSKERELEIEAVSS